MIRILPCRLLGLGKLPTRERAALESEGITVSYEGIWGSVPYKDFRAPGRLFLRRKRWFIGSLAITGQRFVAYAFSRRIFSAPLDNSCLSKWKIFVEDGKRLCLAGQASDFAPNQSGSLEFRFNIPDAETAARLLEKGGACRPPGR